MKAMAIGKKTRWLLIPISMESTSEHYPRECCVNYKVVCFNAPYGLIIFTPKQHAYAIKVSYSPIKIL